MQIQLSLGQYSPPFLSSHERSRRDILPQFPYNIHKDESSQSRAIGDYDDDGEEGLSGGVGRSAKNYTNLQVITAKHVQRLERFSHIVTIVAIIYTVAFLTLQNTLFKATIKIPRSSQLSHSGMPFLNVSLATKNDCINSLSCSIIRFKYIFAQEGLLQSIDLGVSNDSRTVNLDISYPPTEFAWASAGLRIVLGALMFLLFIIYSQRIIRSDSDTTHEQIWIILLLFVGFLSFNIPGAILRLLALKRSLAEQILTLDKVHRIFQPIQNGSFQVASLFYIWGCSETYRILDPQRRLSLCKFYLPKVLVLGMLLILKVVAFFSYKMYLSEIPLLSMISMIRTFQEYALWSVFKGELIYLLGVTVLEVGITLYIVTDLVRTYRFLQKAEYMKHRSKQVGFQFFSFHALTFYVTFMTVICLMTAAKPMGEYFVLLIVLEEHYFDAFWDYMSGAHFLFFWYVVIEAYVNLPADSVGLVKGWFTASKLAPSSSRSFRGSASMLVTNQNQPLPSFISLHCDDELSHQIVEPITYRRREGRDFLELKANCFVMETNLILFNFAWLAYWKPEFEKFRIKQRRLNIMNPTYIQCDETDTCALLVSSEDRIVISFKGTTSFKNLRTNIDVHYAKLNSIVGEDNEDLRRIRRLFERDWKRAKVHRGFAAAYKSISARVASRAKLLLNQKHRPIFVSGHSLGGALATLCSLDLWLTLGLNRREISVTTFGSPRVGNKYFQRLYDSVIPMSWRIVVECDLITRLPFGYEPTGTLVQFLPGGEMFIDPNALKHKLWNRKAAGFAYHRKASYLLAMWAWSVRHHGRTRFKPELWKWPIGTDDTRRFRNALQSTGCLGEWDLTEQRAERSESIAIRNALVDTLQDERISPDVAAFERWAKIVRKTLVYHQLNLAELGR